MNDEQSAALVDELAAAIDSSEDISYILMVGGKTATEKDIAVILRPHIDRLLADRAEESQLLLDEANRHIVQLRNEFSRYLTDHAAIAAMPSGREADLQRGISTWARETFGSTTDQVSQKLRAEYLDLDQYLLDMSEAESDNSLVDPEQARHDAVKEAADVLFMLFQLAENFGFDLLEETRKKFEVNKQRTWEKQADGTYQHKEPTNG